MPKTQTQQFTSSVNNKIEQGETIRVRKQVNGDDLSIGNRELENDPRLSVHDPGQARCALDERGLRGGGRGWQAVVPQMVCGPQSARSRQRAGRRCQPAAQVSDAACVRTAEPEPGFLNGIVGLAPRPEHPIGHRKEMRPVLLKPSRQPVIFVHYVSRVTFPRRFGHTSAATRLPLARLRERGKGGEGPKGRGAGGQKARQSADRK